MDNILNTYVPKRYCGICSEELVYDEDGSITGLEFPCWYCPAETPTHYVDL